MSQFYEYNWPVTSVTDIALAQTPVSGGLLKLNGIYASPTTGQANLASAGFVAQITLSSLQNLGIPFVITGYQNGVFISETLAGPNANTVTSTNCFDIVQSIIPNTTGVNTVQVGVGSIGYFPIILLNTAKQNTSSINYALNMVAAAANPATYQVFLSLKNNLGMGKYDDLTTAANGNFIAPANAATASQLIQSSSLAQNLLVKVGPNANGSTLKFQFLQL